MRSPLYNDIVLVWAFRRIVMFLACGYEIVSPRGNHDSLGGVITAKLLTTNPDRFITSAIGGSAGRRRWTDQDERDAQTAAAEFESVVPYRSLILATAPTDQPPPTEEAIRKRSQEIVATNDPLAHAALVRARRE